MTQHNNSRKEFFAVTHSYLEHLVPLAGTIVSTAAAVADALYRAEVSAKCRILPEAGGDQ